MTEFKIEAKKILEDLLISSRLITKILKLTMRDENLVIQSINEDSTFIINLHEPTSQIWLSITNKWCSSFRKE